MTVGLVHVGPKPARTHEHELSPNRVWPKARLKDDFAWAAGQLVCPEADILLVFYPRILQQGALQIFAVLSAS